MRGLPDELPPSPHEAFDGVSRIIIMAAIVLDVALWALIVAVLR